MSLDPQLQFLGSPPEALAVRGMWWKTHNPWTAQLCQMAQRRSAAFRRSGIAVAPAWSLFKASFLTWASTTRISEAPSRRAYPKIVSTTPS